MPSMTSPWPLSDAGRGCMPGRHRVYRSGISNQRCENDDTCMTMCVAEVATTGVNLRSIEALTAIGERFLHWYRMGSPGIGTTTRAVLTAATTGADMRAAAAAHHARTRRAASNGALMRTAPVALAHLGDDDALVEAAIAVASLTHADPLAGQSCAIWCIAIDRAIPRTA